MRAVALSTVGAVAAGAAVIAATLIFLQASEQTQVACLIGAVPVVTWLAARKLLNPVYISPVALVGLIFAAVAVFGYAFYDDLANAGGSSIVLQLTEQVALQTLVLLSASATIVLVTGLLVVRMGSHRTDVYGTRPSDLTWHLRKPSPLLLLLAVAPLIAFVVDVGVGDFFIRTYYIVGERGSFIASIVTQLATLVIVLLGYMLAAGRGGTRFATLIVLTGYSLMLASFGSRRFALIPILLALGMFLAANTRRTRWGLVIGGFFTAILLPLPLEFRSNTLHGLVPYVETLRTMRWEEVDWLGAANNVLVGFPIIGESAYGAREVLPSDILISINPIAGEGAGWYEIYQRLRLNFYTPMAGIGEVGNVGWIAVVLVFVVIGTGLGWLELSVRARAIQGNMVYVGALIGLVALFALQMTQYNLRQAFRLLVYAVVIEIGRRIFAVFLRKHTVQRTPRPRGLSE